MRYLRSWLPAILWAAFIFYVSSRQGMELPSFPYSDKIIHAGVYTVFGYLIAKVLTLCHGFDRYKTIMVVTLLAGFYGFTDEVHQSFVPTRTAEIFDLIADFIGGFVGSIIYGYVPHISKKN